MKILVTSYEFKECEKELAFEDLEKLHTIRGRILHLSTIIERVLKEKISEQDYSTFKTECKINVKYKKLDFFKLIKLFIKKYEQKYKDDSFFNKIKNELDELRDKYRNIWSHGFVFYELFETDPKDKKYKPINYINNKYPIPIHYKDNYFNRANEIFSHVIYWLSKEKLLDIKRYKIVLQFTDEESKIIEESLK